MIGSFTGMDHNWQMNDYLQTHYTELFKYCFFGSFILLFVWEQLSIWVKPSCSPVIRWWNTISLYVLSRFLVFWLLPVATITSAIYAQNNGYGLLNWFAINESLALIAGFLMYDCCHYALHWLSHHNSILWRLHRVHHSDPDVDMSTELKHHPLEIIVASLFLIAFVIVLGIPVMAIILRTIFTIAVSLFSHANVKIPEKFDRALRLVIITPAMHRVHHSSYQPETDSNYGTLFSFWDRLFGTYVEKPRLGYEDMELGLHSFRSERDQWLDRLLLQPFLSSSQDRESTIPADKSRPTGSQSRQTCY